MKARDEYITELVGSEPFLRSTIWPFARNHADTDELVQDTFARLLAVSPTVLRRVRNVRAFALTTAVHVAIDWTRHCEAVEIGYAEDVEMSTDFAPEYSLEDVVVRTQEIERLLRGLGGLAERSRQVFVLKRVFGFSQKEIAQALGITTITVEQHVTKAIRRLAGHFQDGDLVVRTKSRPDRRLVSESRRPA